MSATQRAVIKIPQIDWYSFLERPRLPAPTREELGAFRGASILITGAGGSIGGALSLRLAAMTPKELVLLDASEQALYRLQMALDSMPILPKPRLVLGNAGDPALLAEIFNMYQPRFVFHAAAYKHVPLLEEHPLAAIENNALNTFDLAELVSRSNDARMVLLSTDKAVEPVSILGATKRIAELITTARGGVALRLGNVLGTEGSVSEAFVGQITNGDAIKFTGSQHRRYFMTCEEAVDLLLLAASKAPAGATLVPAIDGQYSIASLAEFLIARIAPGQTIGMMEAAPRSGDKPCEKLRSDAEVAISVEGRGYFQVRDFKQVYEHERMLADLGLLRAAVMRRDSIAAMEIVRKVVPSYRPGAALLSTLLSQQAGVSRS